MLGIKCCHQHHQHACDLASALVCSEETSMTDIEVVVSAITFGLSYFYYKYKKISERKRKIRQRRLWMLNIHKNRTREYMEEKMNKLLYEPSGQFANFCQMSYTDFEFLLNAISPIISKKNTHFREAIPAKYRLAITLRYLATGDSYKSLHYLFKVSTPAISEIIPEVCRAINEVLKDQIKMPSSVEDWINIEKGYRSKFPHCIGSMDGKHIVIESLPHSGSAYYNDKRSFNIVLLALVDSNYKFIFIDIGCQERISNGDVFNNSLLSQKISRNEMHFPAPCSLPGTHNNLSVPYVFLADDTFALSTHVMKPYPGYHEIGSPKRIFNQHLNRARVVVENTFGILSSVFRIFRRPINLKLETVKEITMTCAVLHNFLRKSITSSEMYTSSEMLDVYDSNGNLITPGAWRNINEYNAIRNLPRVPRRPTLNAVKIRDEFTSYFCRDTNN